MRNIQSNPVFVKPVFRASRVSRAPESQLSFAELLHALPRLREFYDKVCGIHDNGEESSYCANRSWAQLEDELKTIVGWHAEPPEGSDPRLKTSKAYDIARRACYSALPDCRNCGCVALTGYLNEELDRRGVKVRLQLPAQDVKEDCEEHR